MAAAAAVLDSSNFNVDKLTYEIFSILENKFLFGYDHDPKLSFTKQNTVVPPLQETKSGKHVRGKVRILSIDGSGSTDGILAAKSLVHLEASIRRKSGNPIANVADYFDVVAGTGVGGVLAALLFTRGKDGGPLFTAEEALAFVLDNRRKIRFSFTAGMLRLVFRQGNKAKKLFGIVFGELTLKDTLKSVLIPCYDLTTGAPFVFSCADAVESDGYDFKMRDVCMATLADPAVVGLTEVRSVDRRTKIVAVDGCLAMNNPTAAAITHVLNNKQEFPLCNSVDDLLVLSLGNGESCSVSGNLKSSPAAFIKIAGDGASDMVDQAVSLAFGELRTSNYVRIQATGIISKKMRSFEKAMNKDNCKINMHSIAGEMLAQKNVESTLFQGKKLVEDTNMKKLENFSSDLIKEHERRKTCILPTVVLKQAVPSPRTSSATNLSSLSSN